MQSITLLVSQQADPLWAIAVWEMTLQWIEFDIILNAQTIYILKEFKNAPPLLDGI